MKQRKSWAIADEKGNLLSYRDYRAPNLFESKRDALHEIEGYELEDCVPVRVVVKPRD